MNVFVLNSGSSTLKFLVIDTGEGAANTVISGLVDRIGDLLRYHLPQLIGPADASVHQP